MISVEQKALTVNLNPNIYGSFAEIGAGQEVVRRFFLAGASSGTVAKSMSAYDMQFSDAIYGREVSGRYVCEPRLLKMLKHEYELIEERLTDRKDKSHFFAFADTVATSPYGSDQPGHGWLGIRYQLSPHGPCNEIVVHIKMLDPNAQLQAQAIGTVGVNLIYGATHNLPAEELIEQLVDEVGKKRIEIDMIRFSGEAHKDIDNRLMSLKLVEEGFTSAVLFTPQGEVLQVADYLYKKPVLIQRGSFNPVTKVHWDLQESGVAKIKNEFPEEADKAVVLMEITLHNLDASKGIDRKNFLDRMDAIATLDQPVLITNFFLFYQVRQFIQQFTKLPIRMVLGANLLDRLFEREHYANLKGGVLEGFGRLVKGQTKLYIYPQMDNGQVQTSKTKKPEGDLGLLYDYLDARDKFVDIVGCSVEQTQVPGDSILNMIQSGNKDWENYVPAPVAEVIKKKGLFGYNA